MARKLNCNKCGDKHEAGSACLCIKNDFSAWKDGYTMHLNIYKMGLIDGACGQAYHKSDFDLIEIIKKIEKK